MLMGVIWQAAGSVATEATRCFFAIEWSAQRALGGTRDSALLTDRKSESAAAAVITDAVLEERGSDDCDRRFRLAARSEDPDDRRCGRFRAEGAVTVSASCWSL